MNDNEQLRDILAQIAELAGSAANGERESDDGYKEQITCTPKSLPKRLLVAASNTAIDINPMNAPAYGPLAEAAMDIVSDPLRIAVLTSKYWGSQPRRLTVSFMESAPADLRRRIVSHMNAWTRTCGVEFVETQGIGMIRISRGDGGYYSYLGTDVMLIPQNRQTMNLQGFTMNTSESEFKRVIRHEAGHTLGFPHEHMRRDLVARINRQKAYDYFRRTQGWDPATVDQQVLTPLDERTIMGTPADQTSIMCYHLPGSITNDGRPIIGGTDINGTDYGFAGRIYPRAAHDTPPTPEDDWEEQYMTSSA